MVLGLDDDNDDEEKEGGGGRGRGGAVTLDPSREESVFNERDKALRAKDVMRPSEAPVYTASVKVAEKSRL